MSFDPRHEHDGIIYVGSSTSTSGLAQSITKAALQQRIDTGNLDLHVRAISQAAHSVAVKALASARGNLAARGVDIAILPQWDTVPDRETGEDISVIVLRVIERTP